MLAVMTLVPQRTDAESLLPCLQPVQGVTWMRWQGDHNALNAWCTAVGPPVVRSRAMASADITRLRILSWNVHVGGGRVEELLPALLVESSKSGIGLVVLLQETFRGGTDVPATYPSDLTVPRAIRPRRPAMDIVGIAERFGMSVAYVPSMRNGSATTVAEREDRGNAVLSTEPLTDVRAIELPFGKQRRVAIAATVTPRGISATQLRVVVAHLDTNGDRVAQAGALANTLDTLDQLPIVIGGDMNARRGFGDEAVHVLGRVPLESCGTGRTNRWPLRLDVLFSFLVGRLDFMFSTLGASIDRSCETLPKAYHSDHLPVLLTMQYPK